MSNVLDLMLPLAVGVLLGVLFFGGLRWTVQKIVTSPHPIPWMIGSLLLRMGCTLAGFYFVSDGQWKRLVTALFGFMAARMIVLRFARTSIANTSGPTQEGIHAS